MEFIMNIIKRINVAEPKKILGRWNLEYCHKKTHQKVDLSNEDHCGPCGSYILSKTTTTLQELNNKPKNDTILDKYKKCISSFLENNPFNFLYFNHKKYL